MTEPRSVRQRALVAAVAAASAFAAFAVASSPAPTEAAWVVTRTLDVTATAVIPAQPDRADLRCGERRPVQLRPVHLDGAGGHRAQRVHAQLDRGGDRFRASSPGPAGRCPPRLCSARSLCRVAANYGTSWISATGTQTRSVTIIAFGTLWSCS